MNLWQNPILTVAKMLNFVLFGPSIAHFLLQNDNIELFLYSKWPQGQYLFNDVSKSGFAIPRPISSTTENFRTIGWIVLSQRTDELMAKPDFDGRENAKSCIIWTFYCPYLASKWSYRAISVIKMTPRTIPFWWCIKRRFIFNIIRIICKIRTSGG